MINFNNIRFLTPRLEISDEIVKHDQFFYNKNDRHKNIFKFGGVIPFSVITTSELSMENFLLFNSKLYSISERHIVKSTFNEAKFLELLFLEYLTGYTLNRRGKEPITILIGNGMVLTKTYEPIFYIGYNPNKEAIIDYYKSYIDFYKKLLMPKLLGINTVNYNSLCQHYLLTYSSSLSERKLREISNTENMLFVINRKYLNSELYKGNEAFPQVIKKFIDYIITDLDLNVVIRKNITIIPTIKAVKNKKVIDFNGIAHSNMSAKYLTNHFKQINQLLKKSYDELKDTTLTYRSNRLNPHIESFLNAQNII